ncbi:MAG: hypothetical protein AABX11_06910 [Nanoarchaeota archaeon]
MQFDIVNLGKGSTQDPYKYAMPFSGNDARELVKEVQQRSVRRSLNNSI